VGQKSSVDRLPKKLRTMLLEMLNDPACTQAQIVEAVNAEAGEKVLSASAMNRFAKRTKFVMAKLEQTKRITEMYVDRFGAENRNKLGKVVNEQIRLAAYDLMSEIDEIRGNPDVSDSAIADILLKVSKSLRETEQAEKLNAERTEGIRRDALADAAKAVEKECAEAGVSDEAMDKIKKKILGL